MTPETQRQHLSQSDRDELSSKIEAASPEGRPAHPELGPRRIGALLAVGAAVVVLAGVIVAITYSRAVGIAFAGFGIVLFLASPTFWAAVSRARERAGVNDSQKPGAPRSR